MKHVQVDNRAPCRQVVTKYTGQHFNYSFTSAIHAAKCEVEIWLNASFVFIVNKQQQQLQIKNRITLSTFPFRFISSTYFIYCTRVAIKMHSLHQQNKRYVQLEHVTYPSKMCIPLQSQAKRNEAKSKCYPCDDDYYSMSHTTNT